MKKILLLLGMICLLSCTKNYNGENAKPLSANNELIVLAIDISQSFKLSNIKSENIRKMCKGLEARSKQATVLIYPLGNPSRNPRIISCQIQGSKTDTKAVTLSQKKAEVLRRKKLARENESRIDELVRDYEETIYSVSRTAHTDIRSFNQYLYTLANEDQYKDYQKTLFLYSDGVNSLKGVDEFFPLKKEIEGLSIYTCGLAKSAKPFMQGYKELTSYQSFFNQFKTDKI